MVQSTGGKTEYRHGGSHDVYKTPSPRCAVCRTNSGWHLEFKAKTVTDIPSLPGTASFFMFYDERC